MKRTRVGTRAVSDPFLLGPMITALSPERASERERDKTEIETEIETEASMRRSKIRLKVAALMDAEGSHLIIKVRSCVVFNLHPPRTNKHVRVELLPRLGLCVCGKEKCFRD